MARSYNKWWLSKDMENMGYFFEYCDKYCKELFGTNVDKVKLLTEFMNSQFRRKMELGHPRFQSQSAKDSLIQWIEIDYGNDLSDFSIGRKKNEYRTNQFYWIGWMYAYIHYKTGLSSKSIVSRLLIEEMLSHYYLGHEISKETYYASVEKRVKLKKSTKIKA